MQNKNSYYKILTIIFIAAIGGVTVLNTLSPVKDFSESENRVLSKSPKFTFERLVDGRYTKKYEKYKTDQFIGRDFFMAIKSCSDLMLGKKNNNSVYLADDGYLIEDFSPISDEKIKANLTSINNFAKKYKDSKTTFAIVPTAISIFDEKLPSFSPVKNQNTYIKSFYDNLDPNINSVDLYNTLYNSRDEYLYYKTDHHWTSLAASKAYETIKKEMQLDNVESTFTAKTIATDFNGTLASKSGFRGNSTDSIDVYLNNNKDLKVLYSNSTDKMPTLYDTSKLEGKDKYALFLSGNHPEITIKTTARTTDSIIVFKDSYANCFIPFLAEHYSKITVIDPRYYYDDLYKLMEENQYDDILFLYNANTFFSDTSIEPVLKNE